MAVVANDSFTDANGTALTAHTSDSGHSWSLGSGGSGTNTIQSNAVASNGSSRGWYRSGWAPSSADYDVSLTVTGTGGSYHGGPAARMSASDRTYYAVNWENVQWRLIKWVGGTYTSLASSYFGDSPVGASVVVKLSVSGSTIKVFIAGVERYSVTDASITAAGSAGLEAADTAGNYDNWAVDAVVAPSGPVFDSAIFSAPPFDTGSSGGGASVSGVTLTTNASLTFGGVSADSQASGQTLTATASLISGTASASSSATANGTTLTATASLISGSASGTASASVSGVTLTASTSLAAGTLAADSAVSGLTLTATSSLIAGTAAGGSAGTVNGQTLTVSASIIAGSLAADSMVAGVTLTGGAVSLIPGTVAADSLVSGTTFTATTAFFQGSASAGSSGATVNGQVLTTPVFFLAGLADNASLPRFPVRDRARNIVPRKYK